MIVQLTTEAIDYALALFLGGETDITKVSFHFDVFQPAWILLLAFLWLSFRQTIQNFNANPGRMIGLIHAVVTCLMGIPILCMLCSTSFQYGDMFESFIENAVSIKTTANVVCYTSVGYFLMDSFFLVRKAYLKHHVGAIIVFLICSYHHHTSLIHSVCVVTLFELGAVLVQLSRAYPNLIFRTFICIGYTATRLAIGWYYGFIYYTASAFWETSSLAVNLSYIPIAMCCIFLLGMNFNWCYLQWNALFRAYKNSKQSSDFYSFHQQIIGNTTPQRATC